MVHVWCRGGDYLVFLETFSAPGCWRVVAHVGLNTRFVFVMRVEAMTGEPTP